MLVVNSGEERGARAADNIITRWPEPERALPTDGGSHSSPEAKIGQIKNGRKKQGAAFLRAAAPTRHAPNHEVAAHCSG